MDKANLYNLFQVKDKLYVISLINLKFLEQFQNWKKYRACLEYRNGNQSKKKDGVNQKTFLVVSIYQCKITSVCL